MLTICHQRIEIDNNMCINDTTDLWHVRALTPTSPAHGQQVLLHCCLESSNAGQWQMYYSRSPRLMHRYDLQDMVKNDNIICVCNFTSFFYNNRYMYIFYLYSLNCMKSITTKSSVNRCTGYSFWWFYFLDMELLFFFCCETSTDLAVEKVNKG